MVCRLWKSESYSLSMRVTRHIDFSMTVTTDLHKVFLNPQTLNIMNSLRGAKGVSVCRLQNKTPWAKLYSQLNSSGCNCLLLTISNHNPSYALFSNPAFTATSIPSTNFSGQLKNGECDALMLKVVIPAPIEPAIPCCTIRGIALSSSQ